VRTFFLIAVCGALACAQSDKTIYTTDINGHRVTDITTDVAPLKDGSAKQELSQSVNGRQVPMQSTEQHVTKSGTHSTIETITKRYDPTGGLFTTERVVTQHDDLPGGGSSETSTTYRSDVSGNMKEAERRQVDTRVQGSNTTQETVVSRPGLDGSFQPAEKRSIDTQKAGDRTDTKETVYRVSQNGELYPALQEVITETKTGPTTTAQIADYEPSVTGNLQLARQTVSTATTDKAGNETREVNLYSAAADGRVQENGAPQQIKEQQVITRHVASDGTVTETLSVRRPSISDPTKLGGLQQISETVCKGKCINP
jgi:hypothetical protein